MGFFHTEIDIALALIGIAFFDQVSDKTNDVIHKLDHTRVAGCRFHAKSRHILTKGRNILVCHFLRCDAFFFGTVNDLIIHIGKVGNVGNFVVTILKVATNRVKSYRRAGIPNVDIVVNRWPTNIHADLSFLDGDKFSQITRHGIINF